jgi:hypothetical protein
MDAILWTKNAKNLNFEKINSNFAPAMQLKLKKYD